MIPSTRAMARTAAAVKRPSRLRCILISCAIATIILAAALLAVALTVFRVREPVMTMNSISLLDPSPASSSSSPVPAVMTTLTVVADVSVRNPNAASMRYAATETAVYYRSRRVGEARGPPGTAPARRTVRMNVTVGVDVGELVGDPAFLGDVAAGAVAVDTATTVRGRVAVLGGMVCRRVVLEMNCTATIAVADMAISDQSCQQRVSLR